MLRGGVSVLPILAVSCDKLTDRILRTQPLIPDSIHSEHYRAEIYPSWSLMTLDDISPASKVVSALALLFAMKRTPV